MVVPSGPWWITSGRLVAFVAAEAMSSVAREDVSSVAPEGMSSAAASGGSSREALGTPWRAARNHYGAARVNLGPTRGH